MDKKLLIRLFRFNPKTDYLPYYKQYSITIDENKNISELFHKIDEIEKFNFVKTDKFGVKINNIFYETTTSIKYLIEKTSLELTIEPVSTYRCIHDLCINNDDFFEKFTLLEEFLSEEQINEYADTLQLYYYASNTLHFNKDFIGDHCLIAASDIIQINPELKSKIIDLISDGENGIWYHTSLLNRIDNIDEKQHEKIEQLLSNISKKEELCKNEPVEDVQEISQEFNNFNIAVYDKTDYTLLAKLVQNSKANFINTLSKNDDLAYRSSKFNKEFSYKIAGHVLLDALDNNADFIIVNDKQNFTLFDHQQQNIAKAVGRDIDLPVVTSEQFCKMLKGEKDPLILGFKDHRVPITFL